MRTSHVLRYVLYIYRVLFANRKIFIGLIYNLVLAQKTFLSSYNDFISYDPGVEAPERNFNCTIHRVQPKEPDLWPHVLGSEG
jgi:hypothetical protein